MSCVDIKTCPTPITRDYFLRICNTKNHPNCHHFAKRRDDLKPPFGWLQKFAIEAAESQTETPEFREVEMR